jgi:DnaJ-class molecular chaperone
MTNRTQPIDLDSSVAGEEDPGASNEIGSAKESPGRNDQPAGQRSGQPTEAARTMAPGDEAPPGTAGTGEDVCPDCGGSGRKAGGICPTCLGKGTVTVGIGGA